MTRSVQRVSKPSRRSHLVRGVTLIELMVGIAVLGILAAMAISSYSEYVRRAARADAQLTLQQASLYLERRYAECNSYLKVDAGTSPPCTTDLTALPALLSRAPAEGLKRYTISIASRTAQSYQLKAVPDTTDRCGSFVLDSSGARTVENAQNSADDCWRR